MPGESSFDLVDILPVLVDQQEGPYSPELEILFAQFLVWIYFPNEPKMLEAAGMLAATAFLRSIERREAPKSGFVHRRVEAKVLRSLLRDPQYRSIYNSYFAINGWTTLAETMTFEAFNKAISTRCREASTVCDMVDFRFRLLDHTNSSSAEGNISRSEYFVWTGNTVSWKTIRKRWGKTQLAAPFLYASERLGFDFRPPVISLRHRPNFAPKRAKLAEFVKTAFYVAERIGHQCADYSELLKKYPDRVRPRTSELSATELSRVSDYKERRDAMRSDDRS